MEAVNLWRKQPPRTTLLPGGKGLVPTLKTFTRPFSVEARLAVEQNTRATTTITILQEVGSQTRQTSREATPVAFAGGLPLEPMCKWIWRLTFKPPLRVDNIPLRLINCKHARRAVAVERAIRSSLVPFATDRAVLQMTTRPFGNDKNRLVTIAMVKVKYNWTTVPIVKDVEPNKRRNELKSTFPLVWKTAVGSWSAERVVLVLTEDHRATCICSFAFNKMNAFDDRAVIFMQSKQSPAWMPCWE
mmetsp:Transcript_19607/g.42246  ORF Transcript_19607/g.42246 Transcript_19607/m.42246 type:complete len:245 (-) Transcript_19607:1457-2191(-)